MAARCPAAILTEAVTDRAARRQHRASALRQRAFLRPRMPGAGKPLSVRHDELRPARLDTDESRLPLRADSSADRHTVATNTGGVLDYLGGPRGLYAQPPEACLINCTVARRTRRLHQDRMRRIFGTRVFGCRWVRHRTFPHRRRPAAATLPHLSLASGDVLVLGAGRASRFTGSTGFMSGHFECCRTAAASISPSGA